jgi:arylsulfatase A-like enzyme
MLLRARRALKADLLAGLLCVLVLGCAGEERPSQDLLDSFATGVFIAEAGFWRLGQAPGEPELTEAQKWAPLPLVPAAGWEWPGRVGWHPIGHRAMLTGPNRWSNSTEPLRLELEWHRRRALEGVQGVDVSVNGVEVGAVELRSDRLLQSLTVPPEALAAERLEIVFEFSPPLARGEDRLFAVTLAGFGLSVAAQSAADQEAGFRVDTDRRLVRVVRSGTMVVGADRPPGFDSLVWEVRCRGASPSLAVSVVAADLRSESADTGQCGSAWRRHELALGEEPGRRLELHLTAVAGRDEGVIEVRGVRLEAARRQAPAPGADRARPWDTPDRLPDVLLVVLDAARADHFGSAGYPRDTTPNLDRLAEKGLVFERAYSECATTSCSIPNLISGVPFLGVGTVFEGRKIPDEIVTLAEYLGPLGYRSVGLSSNPNNSGRRNSHQGFDRFRKVSGTLQLNSMALEAISEQPEDQPLFLQLHYLPPHQPYRPPPEYDIFTDPGYRGPVHPKIGLRPYTMGIRSFSETDLAQLVGLYDGHLRWADHNVSQVFEALKAAGRWENTLVVVTSDHGEAFGEHGHFSHNSTLFEEMLHVPLIMRLPGDRRPTVDTGSPVGLGDVVPTLLGYVGLRPRPEVRGVDLLAEADSPDAARTLFFRTYHEGRPFLAARSGRWKLIEAAGFRAPMLFDLQADPGETRNLAAEHPEVFARLAVQLRQFLEQMGRRDIEPGEEIELPQDEIDALKALGYVE